MQTTVHRYPGIDRSGGIALSLMLVGMGLLGFALAAHLPWYSWNNTLYDWSGNALTNPTDWSCNGSCAAGHFFQHDPDGGFFTGLLPLIGLALLIVNWLGYSWHLAPNNRGLIALRALQGSYIIIGLGVFCNYMAKSYELGAKLLFLALFLVGIGNTLVLQKIINRLTYIAKVSYSPGGTGRPGPLRGD